MKITDRRIAKLKSCISDLVAKGSFTVRQLASFVGQVISLGPVVGGIARLMSRYCQITVAVSFSYDHLVSLDSRMRGELSFWLESVDALNLRKCVVTHPPEVLSIFGDASSTGCGSFIEGREVVAAKTFSDVERKAHSTWRELENVNFTLKAFLPFIKDRTVKFFVDNLASVTIVSNGSMKFECQRLALDIYETCFQGRVSLSLEWIPRGENEVADYLSRLSDILDTDDWGITPEFFSVINSRFGPFTIDCFANALNKKVDRFYSLFYVPGTSGVDAFSFNWWEEMCLLTPPVAVIGRCLEHLLRCQARGVLVAPLWVSSFFWPMLRGFFNQFIVDYLRVKGSVVLQLGLNPNSLLGSKDFSSEVIAILIDCSPLR